MKRFFIMALAITVASCGGADEKTREVYRDPALSADLPFSSAVVVGDVIYLSGEIGRAPGTTSVVDGGAGAQTRQIFENYEATLGKLGAGLEDIVKCTVFLEDMQDYGAMNQAYAAAFPGDKPARSTMGVDGLALGAAVEIECLAVKS
ncbi:RidA family protein [Hyphococcus sp.]|uniref:RidA family protein n=1 Tax=Hyphococcus sp. TaxID=2038636 RepID=UPI0035C688B8